MQPELKAVGYLGRKLQNNILLEGKEYFENLH